MRAVELAEQTGLTMVWMERCRVLGDQLALAAPSESVPAGQQAPDVPAPTTDAPVPLPARLRALAPWLVAGLATALVLLLVWVR